MFILTIGNSKKFMKLQSSRLSYLFIIHGLPVGGAEKFLISLLSYFSDLGIRCQLMLLSNDKTLIKEVPAAVHLIHIPFSYKIDINSLSLIRRNIENLQPDLIICINAYSFFIAKMALVFSLRRKICLSHHSTKPFNFKNYLQTYLYLLMSTSFDLIIYLCYAQKSYLKEKYSINMFNERVIYNGIDHSRYNIKNFRDQNNTREIKQKVRHIILMVARISPEKNHKSAILTLKTLIKNYNRSVELRFLGSGDENYIADLKSFAISHGLSNDIKFLGFSEDVRIHYSSADMFLLTSSSETFPLSVIEAMSFGLPSVITDVGGASELIVDGFNGYTVPVDDIHLMAEKCQLVLNTSWDYQKISNYAKDKFNLENMLSAYNRAFDEYIHS